jgi:hypothetical protein
VRARGFWREARAGSPVRVPGLRDAWRRAARWARMQAHSRSFWYRRDVRVSRDLSRVEAYHQAQNGPYAGPPNRAERAAMTRRHWREVRTGRAEPRPRDSTIYRVR